MRRIVWSREALTDFNGAIGYIAERDETAAERVAERIEAAIHALAERPHGRPGRVKGSYEKSVTGLPYVIAYALTTEPDGSETLNVLHVIHTRRNWPEGEWPSE
ncbi:MAG TPA: type II toxin-antitoxin system RelE/ParE family toxin [Microvirga sp.]|nr:type II toxin-antitoxin system RelE/ParE family toxin [Microvirga sp.]